MNEWQPIDTAPKNGTPILLGYFARGIAQPKPPFSVGWWDEGKGLWLGKEMGQMAVGRFAPTHWIAIPDSPADSTAEHP